MASLRDETAGLLLKQRINLVLQKENTVSIFNLTIAGNLENVLFVILYIFWEYFY